MSDTINLLGTHFGKAPEGHWEGVSSISRIRNIYRRADTFLDEACDEILRLREELRTTRVRAMQYAVLCDEAADIIVNTPISPDVVWWLTEYKRTSDE